MPESDADLGSKQILAGPQDGAGRFVSATTDHLPPSIAIGLSVLQNASSTESPILNKMNAGHLTQAFDQFGKADENRHRERKLVITLAAAIVTLAIVSLLVLCWMFLHYGRGEYLAPILSHLGTGIAGAIGGFGVSQMRQNKKR